MTKKHYKSSPIIIIAFVILIIAIIGFIVYYLFVSKKTKESQPEVITITDNLIMTSTPSPSLSTSTADWITYSNIAYGLSFGYPSQIETKNYRIKFEENKDSANEFANFYYVRDTAGGREFAADEEKVSFSFLDNPDQLSAKEFGLDSIKNQNKIMDQQGFSSAKEVIFFEKDITLGNKNGYYIKTKGGVFNSTNIYVFTFLSSGILKITNYGADKYFETMLSTIKIS